MTAETDSDDRVRQMLILERQILCSLCSSQVSTATREAVLRSLSPHTWQDPEHRVIYEALGRIGNRAPAAVRDELPAIATRMGFPDVDWAPYFVTSGYADIARLEALVTKLISASALNSPCP